MRLASKYWLSSQIAQPIPAGSRAKSSPTAETLSAVGGGSLTGRQRAFTSRYRSVERNVPTVNLTNVSPFNAISMQDTDLAVKKVRNLHPLVEKSNFSYRFLQEQGTRFNESYNVLVNLWRSARRIQDPDNFNIHSARSTDEDVISASAKPSATSGRYGVTITRLASSNELASDVSSDTEAPLGLTGTIKINGWETTVVASDTLHTLRDKINYGEDLNLNGKFDYAEDLNQNGSLDVFSIPATYTQEGYLPSFYHNEDVNGNGVLDGSEDTNGNERLDGNTAQTGVRAVVSGGQLVLITTAPADIELRFRDPDQVLESLGFLFRNSITKEVSTNRLNLQRVDPQEASISVDGTTYSSTRNVIDDAIPGVVLTLKKTGSETVTLKEDATLAVIPTLSFTISYNNAISFLNKTIGGGGALSNNPKLNTIHSETVRGFFTALPDAKGSFMSVADIGITGNGKEPRGIEQTAYRRVPGLMQDALALPGAGRFSFFNQSERVGVSSSEDFMADVDIEKLAREIELESSAVGELLGLVAGRLQRRLSVHLQPDYGTIRFQQDTINYYSQNQGEAQKRMAQAVGAIKTGIESGTQKNIFRTIA